MKNRHITERQLPTTSFLTTMASSSLEIEDCYGRCQAFVRLDGLGVIDDDNFVALSRGAPRKLTMASNCDGVAAIPAKSLTIRVEKADHSTSLLRSSEVFLSQARLKALKVDSKGLPISSDSDERPEDEFESIIRAAGVFESFDAQALVDNGHGRKGWHQGTIYPHMNVPGQYVFVHEGNCQKEVIVTRDRLRQSTDKLVSLQDWLGGEYSEVHCAEFALPLDVQEWFSRGDAGSAFLNDVLWERCAILKASITKYSDDKLLKQQGGGVLLIGTAPCIELGMNAIGAQVKNINEAGWFQERRNRRLKLLEGQESSERAEFFVHESLVGSVIGKQGENLSRVARLYKVEIRVFPDENGVRRVRLYGNDLDQVNLARAELEYQCLLVPLPKSCAQVFMDWFLNEKNEIKELAATSNLHSLWYDSSPRSIFVCGLKRCIDDFVSGLQAGHRESQDRFTMSPTTGVGSTAVNRSHSSTRSATPLLSPYGNIGNRPPILDALPVLRSGMSVPTPQQSDIRFDFPPTTNSTGHQNSNHHQHRRQTSSREKGNYSGPPLRSHGQNQPAYQLYPASNNNKLTREQSGWWSMESGDYWRTAGTPPEGYSSHHGLPAQGYGGPPSSLYGGTPYGYGYGNSSYTMPSSAYPSSSYQSTFYDPRYSEAAANRSYSPDTFNHHYQENPPSSSYSGGQNNNKQWW